MTMAVLRQSRPEVSTRSSPTTTRGFGTCLAGFSRRRGLSGRQYRRWPGRRHRPRAIRQGRCRIVFTDIAMPGADGFAVLHAARAANPSAYVVMITGYGSLETAIHAVRLGAQDYLTKPFSLGQVDVILRAGQRTARARRTNRRSRQYGRSSRGDRQPAHGDRTTAARTRRSSEALAARIVDRRTPSAVSRRRSITRHRRRAVADRRHADNPHSDFVNSGLIPHSARPTQPGTLLAQSSASRTSRCSLPMNVQRGRRSRTDRQAPR